MNLTSDEQERWDWALVDWIPFQREVLAWTEEETIAWATQFKDEIVNPDSWFWHNGMHECLEGNLNMLFSGTGCSPFPYSLPFGKLCRLPCIFSEYTPQEWQEARDRCEALVQLFGTSLQNIAKRNVPISPQSKIPDRAIRLFKHNILFQKNTPPNLVTSNELFSYELPRIFSYIANDEFHHILEIPRGEDRLIRGEVVIKLLCGEWMYTHLGNVTLKPRAKNPPPDMRIGKCLIRLKQGIGGVSVKLYLTDNQVEICEIEFGLPFEKFIVEVKIVLNQDFDSFPFRKFLTSFEVNESLALEYARKFDQDYFDFTPNFDYFNFGEKLIEDSELIENWKVFLEQVKDNV